MERRRFQPRPEGLESRELLSTASAAAPAVVRPADPNIGPLRQVRIERLPQLLGQINRNRTVPVDIIEKLQGNLRAIEGQLKAPPRAALAWFNQSLRSPLSRANLTAEDAQRLDLVFRKVLESAGANPTIVQNFGDNMKRLAQQNINVRRSSPTTASDYALLMQVAMGVGIKPPSQQRAVPAGPRAQR
jgi:hypothetical protein